MLLTFSSVNTFAVAIQTECRVCIVVWAMIVHQSARQAVRQSVGNETWDKTSRQDVSHSHFRQYHNIFLNLEFERRFNSDLNGIIL